MSNRNHYQKQQVKRLHKDPLQKIVTLMNQYWSIDLMEATRKEKDWAKERLAKQIKGLSNHISPQIKGDIHASLHNKDLWNMTRNIIT